MREHVVIVGGSSGMGRALAAELVAQGSEVTVAGRSPDKLDAVRRELGVRTVAMDLGAEQDIERLFATTGKVSHRPGPRASLLVALNGALASLAAALAVELARLRVNVVSPGWVDTPIWQDVAGDTAPETLAAMAARLPVGRIGRAQDIAAAIIALLRNGFITGTVLHADGGHRLA